MSGQDGEPAPAPARGPLATPGQEPDRRVIARTLEALSIVHGCAVNLRRRGVAPEPELLCEMEGQPVWVALAPLALPPRTAHRVLGRRAWGGGRRDPLSQVGGVGVHEVTQALNRLLAERTAAAYAERPIWLGIRNLTFVWTQDDFDRHAAEIRIPRPHPFGEIWLLCGPDSRYGMLRLA